MKTKTLKIALEGFGSYLGMEKGCFTVKNRSRLSLTSVSKMMLVSLIPQLSEAKESCSACISWNG
jgi:hypothetical protein